MNFSSEQVKALSAPLDRSHVAQRSQGGGQVSYIEAWHAIAEANRIFGFDGWNRETIDLRQIGEPREVNGKIRVDYSARVRITVGGVTRDGCGFGQGIDKDVGQAHESALKEAETDAMKRALMTFGNPFGLALYDKTQANVADTPPVIATITDDQRDIIAALAQASGMTLQRICEGYEIASLKELPATKFAALKRRLEQVIQDKEAA
jgi:DNA repair and recombination protein RAD52